MRHTEETLKLYASSLSETEQEVNPLEKRPRLLGRCDCLLEYSHDKGEGRKETSAIVKQTLLTTSVCFCTDEITSNTKASELVDENGRYVLYYTYLTTPQMKYSRKNPNLFIWLRNLRFAAARFSSPSASSRSAVRPSGRGAARGALGWQRARWNLEGRASATPTYPNPKASM